MTSPESALRLMIIVDEDAMVGREPVYTEIVRLALEAGLAGASAFRGIEGFGSSRTIHTSRILSLGESMPAMIVIIDQTEKVRAFLPQLEAMEVRGVIALDEVELAHPGVLDASR